MSEDQKPGLSLSSFVGVGMFFSTALVQPMQEFDLIGLYIPANPFHSLANNVVPAVVVFSALIGVALIGIEKKESLIEVLNILNRALTAATRFVVRLTPIGVLAIAGMHLLRSSPGS